MKVEIHHYHHSDAEDLEAFREFKQGLISLGGKLHKIHETLNFMNEKLASQEKQLQGVTEELKTGLSSLQTRVDGIIEQLETKNDQTTEIDLTDELDALEDISDSINDMFKPSETASTETGASSSEAASSPGQTASAAEAAAVAEAQTGVTRDGLETDVDSTRDQLRTPVRQPVDEALLDSMEEKPAPAETTSTGNQTTSSSDALDANKPSDPTDNPSDGGRRLVNS